VVQPATAHAQPYSGERRAGADKEYASSSLSHILPDDGSREEAPVIRRNIKRASCLHLRTF
jgi:hypothetical protein